MSIIRRKNHSVKYFWVIEREGGRAELDNRYLIEQTGLPHLWGGQPCAGKDQAVVFATFSTKRWRMAATCALIALPVGRSLPSEPLTSFSATAQLSGALA